MSWSLAHLLVAVGLGAELVNLLGVLGSIRLGWQYWPPGDRNWKFYLHWTLEQVFNVSLLGVTYLTWNQLGVPRPVLAAAGVAFLVTFLAALWAGRDLGETETMGLEGELRTGGLYRYSRNPQYVFYLAATVAFAVFSASPLAIGMSAIYSTQWLLFPHAEEPWLKEQYGAPYQAYTEEVPRFVGWETIRRLTGDFGLNNGQSNAD